MDPARAAALVELGFDFLMSQRVARFVDPARVLSQLEAVLTPALVERVVTRHLGPLLDRERARARAAGREDLVGDALTEEAIDALRELAGTPLVLDKAFLRRVVEQDAVRHLIRSVTEETMARFMSSLRGGGAGSGGGVFKSVGRGAMGLASSMGKALLGGLGPQVEQQLGRASSAFMESSLNVILAHVVDVLSDPDSAQRMADMTSAGLEGVLAMPAQGAWKSFMRLPRPPIDALLAALPGVLAQNLARPEVRAAVLAEVAAWLAVIGDETVGELLGEARGFLRTEAVRVVAPLVSEAAASEAFQAWLARG